MTESAVSRLHCRAFEPAQKRRYLALFEGFLHQKLPTISGNEAIGELDLSAWIQPQLLETALASM